MRYLHITIKCRAPHAMRLTAHNKDILGEQIKDVLEKAGIFFDSGEDSEDLTIACTDVDIVQREDSPRPKQKPRRKK